MQSIKQKQTNKSKSTKKHPQSKCRSNCANHKFRFKPKNEGLYHQNVSVSYCPLFSERTNKHESILPTINADGKKYYPLFCIDLDKDHYVYHEEKYQEEHEKKVKDYVQQKKELYEPKPGRKTRWCTVCKTQYDDYLEHVRGEQHSQNSKQNHYIKEIQKIAGMFSGLHRPDHTILQQQTSEETIINKGENISTTIEADNFESNDCVILDKEQMIKHQSFQQTQQTQELIRPISNQHLQINQQQISNNAYNPQSNIKVDQQPSLNFNYNNNIYYKNQPQQHQQNQTFNLLSQQPQQQQQQHQQHFNSFTENPQQFSNTQQLKSQQLKINNNSKKRYFNQMMEGEQFIENNNNPQQNNQYFNNLLQYNQQNQQQQQQQECRKKVKKMIDLTGDITNTNNNNINFSTTTNTNTNNNNNNIYQQFNYGNQIQPQQQQYNPQVIQNYQNNDFNERWQPCENQYQFDNVALNIENINQYQQNKPSSIMVNGANMCMQQQVQYIANKY